ncbi:MAG: hypothetical protein ACLFN5_06030 [bacterium]
MEEIYPRIFVGSNEDCFYDRRPQWAVIHACQKPCHSGQLQYRGDPPEDHPDYLMFTRGNHLYLNFPNPIKPFVEEKIFAEGSYFINNSYPHYKILIHSRSGISRAPALVLAYLAASGKIRRGNYQAAKKDFLDLYPAYDPSPGLDKYLSNNWYEIFRDQ